MWSPRDILARQGGCHLQCGRMHLILLPLEVWERTPAMVDTSSFVELRQTYPRPHLGAVWRLVERVADDGRLLSVEEVFNELQVQDDVVTQ
jgi:hypothetical protein